MEELLRLAPCGCDLADRAARATDDDAAAALATQAVAMRARWGCAAADRGARVELDAQCHSVRDRLARVVGVDPADLGASCPLRRLRERWVVDAFEARAEAERGQLEAFLGPVPAQTYEAVKAIDKAIAARERAAHERRQREAKPPAETEPPR